MNLTSHRDGEAVLRHLVLGGLALANALDPCSSVADLGSGAGFPGLPIAMLRPETRVTLVESRERRHHFQRTAIRTLGLTNVKSLRGRAESLRASRHPMVVAQAMAKPTEALRIMMHWVEPEGLIVLPGGEHPSPVRPPSEIIPLGLRAYQLPLGGGRRTLWLGRFQPGS